MLVKELEQQVGAQYGHGVLQCRSGGRGTGRLGSAHPRSCFRNDYMPCHGAQDTAGFQSANVPLAFGFRAQTCSS